LAEMEPKFMRTNFRSRSSLAESATSKKKRYKKYSQLVCNFFMKTSLSLILRLVSTSYFLVEKLLKIAKNC
jgi:hypothetical protein